MKSTITSELAQTLTYPYYTHNGNYVVIYNNELIVLTNDNYLDYNEYNVDVTYSESYTGTRFNLGLEIAYDQVVNFENSQSLIYVWDTPIAFSEDSVERMYAMFTTEHHEWTSHVTRAINQIKKAKDVEEIKDIHYAWQQSIADKLYAWSWETIYCFCSSILSEEQYQMFSDSLTAKIYRVAVKDGNGIMFKDFIHHSASLDDAKKKFEFYKSLVECCEPAHDSLAKFDVMFAEIEKYVYSNNDVHYESLDVTNDYEHNHNAMQLYLYSASQVFGYC